MALPISVTAFDADDAVSVTISGLTNYETVTDALDKTVFSGSSVTLSAAEVNSGLTLLSSYGGSDHPVNTLTISASNTTNGETATSAPQTIVVTDPPVIPVAPFTAGGIPQGALLSQITALMDQYAAAGFLHGAGGNGFSQIVQTLPTQIGLDGLPLLSASHHA